MSQFKGLTSFCLLCIVLCFLFSTRSLLGQTNNTSLAAQASGDQTTRALLSEVHQLRLTLQQTNLSTYRAQVLVERLRQREERVDSLRRKLEGIREQIAEMKFSQPQIDERVKYVESQLSKEVNPARRTELEMESKMLKIHLEQQNQREQRQREHEAQLTSQLQIEEAKLSELNERLDVVERELEKTLSADNPQPSGRRP